MSAKEQTVTANQNVEPTGLTTSTGAIQHPASTQYKSKLLAMMNGEQLPNVIQRAPNEGPVSRLWSVYIQGAQNLASKGVTGADVAFVLCTLGFIDLWYQGKCFKAGTTATELPDASVLRVGAATYRKADAHEVMPDRATFYRLTRPVRAVPTDAIDG